MIMRVRRRLESEVQPKPSRERSRNRLALVHRYHNVVQRALRTSRSASPLRRLGSLCFQHGLLRTAASYYGQERVFACEDKAGQDAGADGGAAPDLPQSGAELRTGMEIDTGSCRTAASVPPLDETEPERRQGVLGCPKVSAREEAQVSRVGIQERRPMLVHQRNAV